MGTEIWICEMNIIIWVILYPYNRIYNCNIVLGLERAESKTPVLKLEP